MILLSHAGLRSTAQPVAAQIGGNSITGLPAADEGAQLVGLQPGLLNEPARGPTIESMAIPTRRRSHTQVLALLATVLLALPLIIVQVMPTDTPEAFVFRGVLGEELGRAAGDKLVYYRVEVVEGAAPGSTIAVALDRDYTRGLAASELRAGARSWFQGGLMTPEVFYGEQYLFFGLPQVYVRQVKTGLLWPDQRTELRVLYFSPLETLAAPLQLPFLLRSDSFTYRTFAVLLARCALVAGTIVLAVRRRLKGPPLAIALLSYSIVAVLLTTPILFDLY